MRSLTALDCWVRQLNRSITGISSNWHVNLSMHVKANSVKTSTCRHSCNSVLLIHISGWLISLEWFYALSTFQERISSFTGGFDLVRILRWASIFEILLYRSIITYNNMSKSIEQHLVAWKKCGKIPEWIHFSLANCWSKKKRTRRNQKEWY